MARNNALHKTRKVLRDEVAGRVNDGTRAWNRHWNKWSIEIGITGATLSNLERGVLTRCLQANPIGGPVVFSHDRACFDVMVCMPGSLSNLASHSLVAVLLQHATHAHVGTCKSQRFQSCRGIQILLMLRLLTRNDEPVCRRVAVDVDAA